MMDNCDYVTIFENCDQVALTEHYDQVAATAVFAFGNSQEFLSYPAYGCLYTPVKHIVNSDTIHTVITARSTVFTATPSSDQDLIGSLSLKHII